MTHSGGNKHVVEGVYREIRAPEKLAYTWKWVSGSEAPGFPETLVTVEFQEKGGSTEVVLRHELLPEESREPHEKGWSGCLDRLGKVV